MNIAVIGSVDHGKSTMLGHLLYLTGTVSDHDLEKVTDIGGSKMKTWKYARLLDVIPQEQERGKTHEFTEVVVKREQNGIAKEYNFIDTPGHQTYVRSMIEGISRSCNTACVMVSIPEFEVAFERGNLKEHLTLARAVGVQNVVVLCNKIDLYPDFSHIQKTLSPFLRRLGWKNVPFLGISAYHGTGLLEVLDILDTFPLKEPVEEKEGEEQTQVEKTTYTLPIKILETLPGQLITAGYLAMLHHNGQETEFEIEKCMEMSGKSKLMFKAGDAGKILVTLKEPRVISGRVVIRKDDSTLGFGSL